MGRRFAVTAAGVFAVGASSIGPAPARANDSACDSWQIEYLLSSTVVISDTTLGAGDGSYPNGPGKLVLRFDNQNGRPGGRARLIDYQMKDSFTVVSRVLAWEARVTADTISRTTPNACGVAAEGVLEGQRLRWNGPWSGMRSDGSLLCKGGLCGKFGAPPTGRSSLHVAPHPVSFKPFELGSDLKTLTMGYAVVSRQSSPSQTSRIALSGREVRRACVPAPPCP
jgi:hypothetical protein